MAVVTVMDAVTMVSVVSVMSIARTIMRTMAMTPVSDGIVGTGDKK